MANSNYNIGNKLFTYIAHGVDLTTNITTQYENSLIFIGDEQQIFVPKMHAYVGIGMGSYGNTINAINDLNDAIVKLKGDLNRSLISQMYAGWNKYELSKNDAADKYLVTNGVVTTSKLKPLLEGDTASIKSMTQEVTVRGIADYDPNTQLAYTSFKLGRTLDGRLTGNVTGNAADYEIYVDPTTRTNGIYASSGISVTMHHVDGVTDQDGNVHGTENYIFIDDKLTWSYIASAYTYSMAFAQQYTKDAIDRVYSNILGETESYVGIALTDALVWTLKDNTDKTPDTEENKDLDNTDDMNYGYVFKTSPVTYMLKGNSSTPGEYVEFTTDYLVIDSTTGFVTGINTAAIASAIGENAGRNYEHITINGTTYDVPSLYVKTKSWNGTYDMSIADGIETIKEVAYILDMLTDGTNTVTYCTAADYAELTQAEKDTYTYSALSGDEMIYWKVDAAQNVGIQMAYNLVSLRMDLNDAHAHINLAEDGETTLRSVLATGSKLANITVVGSTKLAQTDSNADVSIDNNGVTLKYANKKVVGASVTYTDGNYQHTLDGVNWSGNTYTSGDMSLTLNLDLAQTYVTALNDGYHNNAPVAGTFGGDYYVIGESVYQRADMTNLTATDNTYYTIAGDPLVATALAGTAVETDTHYQNGAIYYWKPDANATVDFEANSSFEKVSVLDIRNAASTTRFYYVADADTASLPEGKRGIVRGQNASASEIIAAIDGGTTLPKFNGNETVTSSGTFTPTEQNASFYKLLSSPAQKDLVLHPVIDNVEHIATTSWTTALIDAKIGAIADQFTNILEAAKQYTDEKIAALDADYLYSDFDANVWNAYASANSSLVRGSDAYNTKRQEFYNYYSGVQGAEQPTDWPANAQTARENPNSLYHKADSQYLFNVKEEDGIVSAEGRELPSDRITVTAEVWGEGSSSKYQRTYVPVVLGSEEINAAGKDTVTTNDSDTTNAEKLFFFISMKTYDNNIYVIDEDQADYYKVPVDQYTTANVGTNGKFTSAFTSSATSPIDNTYMFESAANTKDDTVYVKTANGYGLLSAAGVDVTASGWNITKIDGHTEANGYSTRFVQIYKKMKHFAEVDLDTIIWDANSENVIYFVAEGKGYGNVPVAATGTPTRVFRRGADGLTYTELTPAEVTALNGTYTGYYTIPETASAPTFYYVAGELDNEGTNSDPRVATTTREKEYITASYRHVDYAHDGHGENEFNVDVKLTNIEDATRENSGLADAYDVRSFFENMFEWVDVSASVTQADNLSVSPAWYSKISYQTYRSMAVKPDLYYNANDGTENAPSFVKAANADAVAVLQQYGRDSSNGTQIYGPTYPDSNDNNTSYYDWPMLGNVRQTYYVLDGTPKINPLNLSISKYVTKLYDIEYKG